MSETCIPSLEDIQATLREEGINPEDLRERRSPAGSGLLVNVGEYRMSMVWSAGSYSDNQRREGPIAPCANFELAIYGEREEFLPLGLDQEKILGWVPWTALKPIVQAVREHRLKDLSRIVELAEVENV